MQVRMHRGGLKESLLTLEECNNTSELINYFEKHDIEVSSIRCQEYDTEIDSRIGWKETYIILGTYKGDRQKLVSVIGFSDGFVDIN